MHFFTAASSLLASAALSSAASVTFWSLDDVTRDIVFTPAAGFAEMPTLKVPGGDKTKQEFPTGWNGNWYAVPEGDARVPGMLGEVLFNGWMGLTYFDVSAIVNPQDKTNVKQMWVANEENNFSGCVEFPCDHAYYLPDDLQTVTTLAEDLMCSLGQGSTGLNFLDTVSS